MKEVVEFPNENKQVKSEYPFALKVVSAKSTIVVYIDSQEKLNKWKAALEKIINFNLMV